MFFELSASQELFELVRHLYEFDERARKAMSRLYEAPGSSPEELAEFWVRSPDVVLEVARRELKSAAAWQAVEEVTIEHDVGAALDWASARSRRQMKRLGLIRFVQDDDGNEWAVMPGLLASIFAPHVTGDRGSLPILLGRSDLEKLQGLCQLWELPTGGSKLELIGRLIDHFSREEMVQDILEALPSPDWIGDALMILELGGLCFWQQIYGYDLETALGEAGNVIPLMRRADRQRQQEMAEALMDHGVIFRLESLGEGYAMVAVPEELWKGLWQLGRVWLLEWTVQAVAAMEEEALGQPWKRRPMELQAALKWLVIEAKSGRLRVGDDEIDEDSRDELREVLGEDLNPLWRGWWDLGYELGILAKSRRRAVKPGPEYLSLLNRRPADFQREVLLEWCLNYAAIGADFKLGQAFGLDDEWRKRAVQLLHSQDEMVPFWMEIPGVESATTGGGWLREPGTGGDELIDLETRLTVTFVILTKFSWLDLLSLLPTERSYTVESLVELAQCVAALSMFTKLGMVLRNYPIAVYLPFQRASFLMDHLHESPFREWVEDIIDDLFVPLGIAEWADERDRIMLDTEVLRIESPPGWPEDDRRALIQELFGEEAEFEMPRRRETELRAVAPGADAEDGGLSIEEPIQDLLAAAQGKRVLHFDGKILSLGSDEGSSRVPE